jgi:hypothetical protein
MVRCSLLIAFGSLRADAAFQHVDEDEARQLIDAAGRLIESVR